MLLRLYDDLIIAYQKCEVRVTHWQIIELTLDIFTRNIAEFVVRVAS